jgi:hypothetical protein
MLATSTSSTSTSSASTILARAPTIRRRIAQLEAAGHLMYTTTNASLVKGHSHLAVCAVFNEGMRTAFEDLLTQPSPMPTSHQQHDIVSNSEAHGLTSNTTNHCRADFDNFVLGVTGKAEHVDSKQELALAKEAHEAISKNIMRAVTMLELCKAALDNIPVCAFAKPLYPDWTSGSVWINKCTMRVMRVDPKDCPNQMMSMITFMALFSLPETMNAASAHAAFTIVHRRSHACHYRVYTRSDGTRVAGMHSNNHMFGKLPPHRPYFSYIFFQPLPVQPSDIDEWARNVMITHPAPAAAAVAASSRSSEIGWTAKTVASAKYPGVMSKLIRDHVRIHPQDEMSLPPCPQQIDDCQGST